MHDSFQRNQAGHNCHAWDMKTNDQSFPKYFTKISQSYLWQAAYGEIIEGEFNIFIKRQVHRRANIQPYSPHGECAVISRPQQIIIHICSDLRPREVAAG